MAALVAAAAALVLLNSLAPVPASRALAPTVELSAIAPGYTGHAPIAIFGDQNFTAANGVVSGSGTAAAPYVIADWDINASTAVGLTMFNTTAFVVIRHVNIHGGWNHAATNLSQFHRGMYFTTAAHVWIEDSTFSDNDDGLLFYYADDVTIEHSTFYGNAGTGVDLWGTDVVIGNNTFRDQGLGFRGGGTNLLIAGNNFYRNDPGALLIDYGNNITVRDNNLADLTTGQIEVYSATNATFYHNNILNEYPLVFGTPNGTRWDAGYPAGGNYWGTYHGYDNCSGAAQDVCTGGDGIGDTPFVEPWASGVIDRYPLLQPYGQPALRPFAEFIVNRTVLHPGDVFTVDANASRDPGGVDAALTFRWRWGDGSVNESFFDGWDTFWMSEPQDAHAYAQTGTYNLTLQVRGLRGWTNMTSVLVTVTPVPFDWAGWMPTFIAVAVVATIVLLAAWNARRNRRRLEREESNDSAARGHP